MKTINKILFWATLSAMPILGGCALKQMAKMAKEQKVTVEPAVLEVHADTVKFSVTGVLPLKMLKKNKVYSAAFYYRYRDEDLPIDSMKFSSNDPRFANYKTQEPTLTKAMMFSYKPSMKNGTLVVKGKAMNLAETKSVKAPDFPDLAFGCITTSYLIKPVYYYAYAEHGYNDQEELDQTKVDFYFDKASSKFNAAELKTKKAKSFEAFMLTKLITRTVAITGTHSPEGEELFNKNLSDDRALAMEKFYTDMMKKLHKKDTLMMKRIDSIKFVKKGVYQDWSEFKARLDSTKLSAEDKAAILGVVDGPGGFRDKEMKLQKMPSYKTLLKEVYPKLRAAKTVVFTVKKKKSNAKIYAYAKMITKDSMSLDSLKENELMFSATQTTDLKEKEAIYKYCIKKNDSWQAHNNLGAVYLEMAAMEANIDARKKLIDMALTQLELANKIDENSVPSVNMAVAYVMQSVNEMGLVEMFNFEKLNEALVKTQKYNPSADVAKAMNSIRAIYELRKAKYDLAAKSCASGLADNANVLYNNGLAYLLNKQFDKAQTAFNEALKVKQDGLYYYGLAIVAARTNKEDMMSTNLQKAISLNASLRAYALDDLEFLAFRAKDSFKNATK